MREISGDIPLSRPQQVRYLFHNLARGMTGLFARVPKKRFHPPPQERGESSFFRIYIDTFFLYEVPKIFPKRVVRILDIGCGSGYVRTLLTSRGYSGEYTGIDVVHEERFARFDTPLFITTFIEKGIERFSPEQTFDFVISNTSLEHIPDDANAVRIAHASRAPEGIEVHVVPSFWCLFLYVWHGYRQYTPRRIKRLFAGSHYAVYPLGGIASFLAHFFLITIPERTTGKIIFRNRPWYPRVVAWCMQADRFAPLCPMGYAIVVYEPHS
ncbi:MAG: class I SAM-dependent methyltransferase [Patescibacteria group bacterium]